MSIEFERRQRLVKETKDDPSDEKWYIQDLKKRLKEIKHDPREREQMLKVQKRINGNKQYNETGELTVQDFDNLYTSYVDFIKSEKVPLNQKLVAHNVDWDRKNDEPYFFSYQGIANDLVDYGCQTTWQGVRAAVRQLIDIKLFYKQKTTFKGKMNVTVESLHINYKRLKILTESRLKGTYEDLKGTEKTVANWPFVICKYDLTDKEEYKAFTHQIHLKINGIEAVNKVFKDKPKNLQTPKEIVNNKQKNNNKRYKDYLKNKNTT